MSENGISTKLIKEGNQIAKAMLKKGADEVEKRMSQYLTDNAPLGVCICGGLVSLLKDQIKQKDVYYKEFISICDKVIDNCNKALEDGEISKEERVVIQNNIGEVLKIANEAHERQQKDKKHIILAAMGGISIVGLVGAIANAFAKTTRK